jgi:hypothetical protein
MRRPWPVSNFDPGIRLEIPRKTMEIFGYDSPEFAA